MSNEIARDERPQEVHSADKPGLRKDGQVQLDSKVDIPCDFFCIPVPKHLRHDPEKPAHFGLFLNIVFALATTFSAYSAGLFLDIIRLLTLSVSRL